jgi:hypothetical protein
MTMRTSVAMGFEPTPVPEVQIEPEAFTDAVFGVPT